MFYYISKGLSNTYIIITVNNPYDKFYIFFNAIRYIKSAGIILFG